MKGSKFVKLNEIKLVLLSFLEMKLYHLLCIC